MIVSCRIIAAIRVLVTVKLSIIYGNIMVCILGSISNPWKCHGNVLQGFLVFKGCLANCFFWRGFVSEMSRFFKSAQHIFHFTSLDFHIIPGGFPCLPGGKLLSGSTRRIFENFTFFSLSRAVHTEVLRQGLIYLRWLFAEFLTLKHYLRLS